jgi:N-acyl-D-amino-acid deacylase
MKYLPALLSLVLASNAVAFDVLIENGKVIDGSGNAWFYADVAIDGDKVVAIGDLPDDAPATLRIDARGLVVAPGFIDVHTHVDDDILKYPLAENFVRNGVTTIVSGNCGGSELDVGDFFRKVRETGSAVNNATLIGHNTVLRKVKGPVKGELTPEQMEQARLLVHRAMRDGAVGFSTGLIYTPGTWSDTEEIIQLAKVAGQYKGIYVTHMRSEAGGIQKAIEEALRVGRESGCRVEISHFKLPTDVAEKLGRGSTINAGSDVTLAMVDAARAAGQEVWLDQYPYTASSTTLNQLLPDWVLEGGPDKAKLILTDTSQRDRVMQSFKEDHEVARGRKDLSYCVVASSKFGDGKFNGKSIKQITQLLKLAREKGKSPELLGMDSLPDVTMEEQYQTCIDIYLAGGGQGVFHSMDETEVANIMRHPLVGIASDSGIRVMGAGVPHPRGYGTNTRVLGRYVRELKVIPLEDAIRKMTSLPATAFRFDKRGLLREGYFADVTIFDPETVIDRATFENPHQYPVGIRYVMVNGKLVFDGEKMTGTRSGTVLLGPGAPK